MKFWYLLGSAHFRGWLICVGCVGRSGLSGSNVKPHFHASLIFSDPLRPTPTHSDPLQPTPTHFDPLHEWVVWVGVGCVGRSGLEWVKWFKGKTSFPCIIDILQKEAASCFFYCFEFLFKPLHPCYPLQPLYTLHPIIINYSYFALVVQTLLMQDWSKEKIDPDRIGRV